MGNMEDARGGFDDLARTVENALYLDEDAYYTRRCLYISTLPKFRSACTDWLGLQGVWLIGSTL